MFEKTRELQKQERLRKKGNVAQSERKLEKMMRIELIEVLERYLENNDSVEVEVDVQNTAVFQRVCEQLTDYDCEQTGETLYKFRAKEFVW